MPDIKTAIVGSTEETSPTTSTDVLPLVNAAGTTFKKIKLVTLFEAIDALQYKGVIDCSANPNYPAANAGHVYKVSVAGKIGGGSGPNVEAGDTLICAVDSSTNANHATVGANWGIIQTNLDGAATADSTTTFTNKKISLTAAHGSDDTYQGIQIPGLNNSGGVTQWDAVYLNGSSQWVQADANGSGTYPARGLAVSTETTGNPVVVLINGTVRNDAWAWTPGGTIYLSGTLAGLTQTQPATSGDKVQAVGYALTADIAYFDFNSFFFTVT